MCTSLFAEKKIIFDKITVFFDSEILQFLVKALWKVCILSSTLFYNCLGINLNLCRDVSDRLKFCICFDEEGFFFTKLWPSHSEKF